MAMRAPQYEPLQVAPAAGVDGAAAPSVGGNQLAGLGAAVGDAAALRADGIAKAQRQFDEVAVLAAESALTDYTTSRRVDLLHKRGQAAFETHATLLEEWDKEAAALGAKLTSPGARAMFAERQARLRAGLNATAQDFIAGEGVRYDDETTERAKAVQRAAALAAAEVGDLDGFRAALAAQGDVVRGRYARQAGRLDATLADADVRAEESATVAAAIDGFLSRGEDQYAAAGLAMFGDRLDPATRGAVGARVEKAVRIGSVGREADRIVSDALDAEGDVTLAERESEALANVALLSEDVREDVLKRVKDGFAEARRLEADRQRDAHAAVDRRWQDGEDLATLKMSPAWGEMTPDAQRAVEKLDADRRKGLSEPAAPDPGVYAGLVAQYADPATRGAFFRRDILADYPDLTSEQRREVKGWWDAGQTGAATPRKVEAIQTSLQVAQTGAEVAMLGVPKGERDAAKARYVVTFMDALRARRDAAVAGNKPFDEEAAAVELRDKFNAQVLYDTDWVNEYKPLGALEAADIDVDAIPQDVRDAMGPGADDDLLREAYLYKLTYGVLP